jgi:hypothetical protein
MYNHEGKIVNYSKPVQQERRRYPREMITVDDKRTSYKNYVATNGTYFRNYYYIGNLSISHLELDP